MEKEKVPNAFQRQTLWTAITALSITMIGALIVGWVGWKIGAVVGIGTAWVLSCLGGGVGFYYGRRWFDRNLG